MSGYCKKTPVFWGILLFCVLFLFAAALADEPPISFSAAEPNPKVLTNPGTVQVSISISNTSDSSIPVTVTLHDPSGNVCTSFGSGGTTSLSQGQAVSYSGSWSVSQKELDAGKIIYNASFKFQNEAGEPVSGSRPIPITIKKNTAVADLDVQRVPPTPMDGAVIQGQTVVLQYQLKNVGTIELTDITITDKGIFDDKVTISRLAPGEMEEVSYSYVAGASAKTSEATIAFKYQEGGSTKSKSATSKPFVLNVTVPELVITLEADTLMVNPGSKVNLTYTISNKGDIKYEQLKITDKTINDIESGITVEGGKEYTKTREVTINEDVEFQFTVTGTSSAGPITVTSELIKIQTIADGTPLDTEAIPVVLEVVAEADREIIYEEPSDTVFHITITNNGTTDVKNVNVTERGKSIKVIPEIKAGASFEFYKRLRLSSGGLYRFVATAKDNKDADQSSNSNEIRLTYKPLPTVPPPPATATPEPPPETEAPLLSQTNEPNTGLPSEQVGMGTVLLWILAGLLAVVLMAVGVLVLLEKRRSGLQASVSISSQGNAAVIDTLMRNPHRDYARAPKRTKPPKSEAKGKSALPQEEPIIIPSTPEVESEPMPEKASEAKRPKRTEPPEMVDEKSREDHYKRPAPKKESLNDAKELDSAAIEEIAMPDPEPENSGDYLESIRKVRREENRALEVTSETKAHFDEQAALLSGSTGQYRLSRGTKTTLPGVKPKAQAQDPESFSRRQRASRTQNIAANELYYDDEEDADVRASRKKRK